MSLRSANRGAAVVVAIVVAITPVLQALPHTPAPAPAPQTAKAPQTTKTPPPTAKTPPAKAQPATPPVVDGGWPRNYATKQGRIVIYEPQIASWTNQSQLVAFAATSYQAQAAAATATAKPALGTIKLEATTSVSLDSRLVNFGNLRITESNFPTVPKEQLRDLVAEISKAIPDNDPVIALDRVLAFVDKSAIVPRNVPGLKADPPVIFFSSTPAVVVNFDGDPIWSPITKNDLKFAVNTNWDVFQHEPTKAFFLRYNDSWLTAPAVTGPWVTVGKLPPSFAALPADESFADVKKAVPGKSLSANQKPAVNVSLTPAELILLRGAPAYLLVTGTKDLLWVSNTESDVFRMGKTGPVYYLVAGRWFSAPDFTGPWTFATPKLPEDFKKIPLEHERSRVLASVPGTDEAIEAVLLAQIPQTARVDRTKLEAPPVSYNGAPEFKAIEGTSLQRGVNTDKDIILSGGDYYYCSQGVWFTSKAATGPWQVATTIPAEIYKIPASSPSHHVTYVVVEDDDNDNDEWVTFAYVAGYTGLMIGWGCAVWGSGWYYPPYAYGGIYYPHFGGYGYSAHYNPWTGSYGRSAVAYGPYGGVGASARYNPRTGTYSRGAAAWGPYGARGAGQAYNPRTGAYGQTRQGSNVYGSWGSTSVQRGDDWAQTNRVTNRAGTTTRVTRTDEGAAVSRNPRGEGGGFVAAGDDGNVYAGRDGNVYRKENGSWQQHQNGDWGDVNRPTPQSTDRAQTADRAGASTRQVDSATMGQLDRDQTSRSSGSQRTKDYGTVQSSGGSRGTGSYRGASGGSRGGGGRRR
jgi:hypothetical protein